MSTERYPGESEPEEQLTAEEWAEEYELLLRNPPKEGDFLWTQDYKVNSEDPDVGRIKLEMELNLGEPPFIFARAYIPNVVGRRPNWYVYGMSDSANRGWKIILHPRSRDEALVKFGVKSKFLHCRCLRVVHRSLSGRSIVAEVTEW